MSSSKEVQKKIIHVDMDCFYAAVEVRDNPKLKGKPVAVGGSPGGRGVLTTANYEAREFGLRSAMATSQALRLCPQVHLVPVNMSKYKTESAKIRKIFYKYTNKVEPLSLDEAYLDVTNNKACEGSATLLAQKIREEIYSETGLTASAGIAPNKFLAKVASDWKKPNGQFTVSPHFIDQFVPRLPVEKIPGVGKVTKIKMNSMGIYHCKDLQVMTIQNLNYKFGSWGLRLYDLSRGIDNREICIDGERKSLSVESTYSVDLESVEQCVDKVPKLYEEFSRRLQRAQVESRIKSLFVKIKFFDFQSTTYEKAKVQSPTPQYFSEMIEHAFSRQNKPVRLLGLGVKLECQKTKPKTAQLSLAI